MHTRYLHRRGSGFFFRCRVPSDLQHHFPSPTIRKNLKATSEESARIAVAAVACRTEQLFLLLRVGMLPKELEKLLVAAYLQQGVQILGAMATNRPVPEKAPWASEANALNAALDSGFAALATDTDLSPKEARDKRATV